VIEEIIQKFQSRITKRIDSLRGQELDVDKAEDEVSRLIKFAKELEPDFEVELNDLIRYNLINTSTALLKDYKNKLASLTEDIDIESEIKIDPLKIMGGSVADDFSTNRFIKEKDVEDGVEWIKNKDKKWYKPWTWLQDSKFSRKKYKTVKYVSGGELAQEFFTPIQSGLYDNGKAARDYASKQSKQIAERFNDEFKRLDGILKDKLVELESFATDKEKAEERVKKSEHKLKWLEQIKAKVESILEI